jgi:hypothetical protein
MKNFALLTVLLLISQAAFGQWYWGSMDGKDTAINLTQRHASSGTVMSIEFGTADPTAVATNASQGSLYINGSAVYRKTDNGSSTNWVPLLSTGSGAGTDDCLARWNGTGVFLLQDSAFCVTDAGVGSGLSQLNLENLRLDGNTISSTDANGNLNLTPNGTGQVVIPYLTATRVPVAGASGALTDDAGLTYATATDVLTVAGPITIDNALIYAGNREDAASTFFGGSSGRDSTAAAIRNTAFGLNTLIANTAGDNNTMVGWMAGDVLNGANSNTGIGSNALGANETGHNNTAVGVSALALNTVAGNTAVGYLALTANTTGTGNVAHGFESLLTNATGTNNTAIGYQSGRLSTGSGNVYLGYQAGANSTGSNGLFIDNSNTATPLIGGDFSTDVATINGELVVTGLSASLPVKTNGSDQLVSGAIDLASATEVTGVLPAANMTAMVGASGVANGVQGVVPQPLIANQFHFLRGDGTWQETPSDAPDVTFTPTTPADWTDPDPVNVQEGLDDLATKLTGAVQSIGTIDSQTKSADGAVRSGTTLVLQTADNDDVGLVSIAAQSFAGLKTFVSGIIDSTLTSGRCLVAGALGRIVDDAGCTYDTATDALTVGAINANSTTLASNPCPDMTTAQRTALTPSVGQCVYDTDLKTTLYYDGANWAIQGVQPVVTPWESYTPSAYQGIGTPSSVNCRKRMVGDTRQVSCHLTLGTVSAAEMRIQLPTGDVASSSLPTLSYAGPMQANESTSSSHDYAVFRESGTSYLTFGFWAASSTNGLTKQNGNAFMSSGSIISFTADVPLANAASTVGTYSVPAKKPYAIKYYNDTGCFASYGTGSFGAVTDADCDYASATKTGNVTANTAGEFGLKVASLPKGLWQVYVSGSVGQGASTACSMRLYDVATGKIVGPIIVGGGGNSGGIYTAGIEGIVEYASDTANVEWRIEMIKTGGADSCYVNASDANTSVEIGLRPVGEMITASFQDTMTAPGTSGGAPKMCAFEVNHAADTTTEKVGDCFPDSTAVNVGTGSTSDSFTGGYWSVTPHCVADSGTNNHYCHANATSATAISVIAESDSHAALNTTCRVICIGY